MSTYFDVDRVKYKCSCGDRQAFCRVYLCRHCLLLRCQECVMHEVDNYYCPNCLEILPLSEATVKKNRCSNCVDCPSCGHTLATRATSTQVTNPDDPTKSTPKKIYYMACGFCRWTTRDGGIPDQPTASGCWVEQDNSNLPRIKTVLEYYHKLACKEQLDLNIKKYSQKRKNRIYSDKYVSALSALPGAGITLKTEEEPQVAEPATTITKFAPLPEDFFTADTNIETVSTIEQRFRCPAKQAATVGTMYPVNKHLLVRKSYRCKECEHNISKPDYNPMSIKFKILMAATNHIPEVRMMNKVLLQPHKECSVVITLTNPTIYNTAVKLLPSDDDESTTAKVQLPECEFLLSHCDHAAAVAGDSKQQTTFKDDRSVVVFRNANKIGVMLKVTPLADSGPVTMSLVLAHEYRNTTVSVVNEESEIEVKWLKHDVLLHLGHIDPV